MKQSTVIFATLTFAFVVYITLRGQLPAYLALFSSSHDNPTPASSGGGYSGGGGGGGGGGGSDFGNAVKSTVIDKAKSMIGGSGW